ncbi:MAG TPA: hypothetical protein G4O09_07845 [Dehalococcoidia bacterium]|nr:hypothetical protein [Dehalococcoidia bacterium]
MQFTYLLVSTILTGIAFLANGGALFLVLSRGRQNYHYLFAAVLAAYAISSLSIFLLIIRNSHPDELTVYFSVNLTAVFLSVPCIYHFTCRYLNQPRKKSLVFAWAYTAIITIITASGLIFGFGPTEFIRADWGTYLAFSGGAMGPISHIGFIGVLLVFIWSACWFLFRARRRETSPLARRHMQYILISFLAISCLFLSILIMPTQLEVSWLIYPIRTLLIAAFGALIGIAIVKERLFDITVVVKKTTLYSIFLAIIVFVFSFSEHLLASYVGEFFGEHSIFIHMISIAVAIAILMPVRQKIERAIERLFAKKTVEF